jgi:hypothetical protein
VKSPSNNGAHFVGQTTMRFLLNLSRYVQHSFAVLYMMHALLMQMYGGCTQNPKKTAKKGGHTVEHIMHVAEFDEIRVDPNEKRCHACIKYGVTLQSRKGCVPCATAMTQINFTCRSTIS